MHYKQNTGSTKIQRDTDGQLATPKGNTILFNNAGQSLQLVALLKTNCQSGHSTLALIGGLSRRRGQPIRVPVSKSAFKPWLRVALQGFDRVLKFIRSMT